MTNVTIQAFAEVEADRESKQQPVSAVGENRQTLQEEVYVRIAEIEVVAIFRMLDMEDTGQAECRHVGTGE